MPYIAGCHQGAAKLIDALLGPGQHRGVKSLVLVIDVDDVVRAYVQRFPEGEGVQEAAGVALGDDIKPLIVECERAGVEDGRVVWSPKGGA